MDVTHPWQEYNEHGNTCHHPGCRLSEDEHRALAGDQLRATLPITAVARRAWRRWWMGLSADVRDAIVIEQCVLPRGAASDDGWLRVDADFSREQAPRTQIGRAHV